MRGVSPRHSPCFGGDAFSAAQNSFAEVEAPVDEVFDQTIESLHGVGQKRSQLYRRLGVETVGGLLHLFPRSYIDVTNPVPISQTVLGETAAVRARVYKKLPEQRIRKGLSLFKVYAADGSANLVITIFNNRYAYEGLKLEQEYLLYGKVGGNFVMREMNSPLVLQAADDLTMQPVYPLTEGLTSKMVITNQREALGMATGGAHEPLPKYILEKYRLCSFNYALQMIHFPKDSYALGLARRRLVFEELFTWQLGLALVKLKNSALTDVVLKDPELSGFLSALPFTLTGAQRRAVDDCLKDVGSPVPMNRLVQGDVGSGKTMVAAAVCYAMAKGGYQSAMMAPTEILAAQHFATLDNLLAPLGVGVCLLIGSLTKKQKELLKQEIKNGGYDVVVGTHALVQASTEFRSLGFVITDEQHRFGVGQRQKLVEKGNHPHVLVMSATPIPRTLSLILYGDLDISVIDELPRGRQKIDTFFIPPTKRERAFGFIKRHLDEGRQAYIVCPMIQDGEQDVANVDSYARRLREGAFREYAVGVLHGKMKADEKEKVMLAFKNNEIQLLVSTTVVEVGVDVPNAVVMMVENAELFGLSQLHQLRGRVGRGEYKSSCILVSGLKTEENLARLQTMCETSDGFAIAEQDLKQRGPGDFFGKRQHGLPAFKIADMAADMAVLQETQQLARQVIEADPALARPEHKGLRGLVASLFTDLPTI